MRSVRNKEDMWAKIAQELNCSIDEAEAVHWELGEADLARRVGVTPFTQTLRPRNQKLTETSGGNRDEQPRVSETYPEGR
jgi:hypothetical protein